jgi:hypothetical protein
LQLRDRHLLCNGSVRTGSFHWFEFDVVLRQFFGRAVILLFFVFQPCSARTFDCFSSVGCNGTALFFFFCIKKRRCVVPWRFLQELLFLPEWGIYQWCLHRISQFR